MERLMADRVVEKRIESGAWGALLVWVGVVLLANLGWPAFLIGVGVLVLVAQAARRLLGLRFETFGGVVGVLFVVGGIWDLVDARIGLVPVLAIVGGILLLASALFGRQPPREELRA